MQRISRLWKAISPVKRRHLDPSSLQFRLTAEIAALFVLGLGSVAIWTSWKMQQILIAIHQQNVEYIAARFSHDVELYSEMLSLKAGVQKTINNVAVPGLLIWVKGSDGKLLAQSASLNHSFTATTSEVKELAQTFNMMLSRLFDAWEQQRQFVSNVSHELRTPLTVVLGYLQSVLRRSTNLNDYQQEALETAASEADRTVRLLQNLLDLARADSGYMHFHLESLVLNDLVAEVAGMAEKFSDRFVTVKASTEIEAMADRDRLKQVLINLVDNAVKYSESDQPISLKLEARDRQAVIQVCDRGVGIPLQDQSRIFERFYRVDEARSRMSGGHGLGLAIVKTLVEGNGW
jgi:signal transduction histidine kinase